MTKRKVLVVDDSSVDLEVISLVCDALGCSVDVASDGFEAIKLFQANRYDLVLTDYVMEPMNGVYVVSRIKELDPTANCILVTGFPDAAVRRVAQEGVVLDLVIKPIHAQSLKETLRLALNSERGATEQSSGIALSNRMDACAALQGDSEAIRILRQQIAECAACDDPLLLEGGAGGNQLTVARFLHENGPYGGSLPTEVNCGELDELALSRDLLGADDRWGVLLDRAKGGTLILNRIEALPRSIQLRLAQAFDAICSQMYVILVAETSIDAALERAEVAVELYFKITMKQITVPSMQ